MPVTNKDPVWSLRPWPVEVDMGSQTFTVPAVPAIEWLKFLLEPEPDLIGLVNELMPDLEEFFYDNDILLTDFYGKVLEVLATASARSWWIALRVICTARDNWHIVGPNLMIYGIDANSVSLAAWLDIALFILIENIDPKNVTMFTSQLEVPPPDNVLEGTTTEAPAAIESMTMDHRAFMAMAR